MKDDLGNRMKAYYEDITRMYLPRRSYTIIRIDGKAFHTFTKRFEKPFDVIFINMMNETAKFLCENVQGCKIAYVQSDEISLVLTDFDELNTSAWFDGNIQKIVSVAASLATARFNQLLYGCYSSLAPVQFDARTFTIPTQIEVTNYLIWRQKDAERNSISMVAQSNFSHKELHGKNTSDMKFMLAGKDKHWEFYPTGQKRGRCVYKQPESKWMIDDEIPIFTQNREFLLNIIPNNI